MKANSQKQRCLALRYMLLSHMAQTEISKGKWVQYTQKRLYVGID